ncbi:hypothetical protein ACQKFK_32625 [Bacillus mycoides]
MTPFSKDGQKHPVSKFDTIRVFAVGATSALPGTGEFCITPRYALR